MKEIALSLLVAAMLAAIFPVAAFAHGGHHGARNVTPQYDICHVDECEIYGPHEHDGGWYCSQSGVNWSDYTACTVDKCNEPGLHEHGEIWYHCASYTDAGYKAGHCRNR